MKILRTPDACFANLKDYPFDPCYTTIQTQDGSDLRIHHIDEGPRDGPILLAMHGQPVWSYLYAKMIPLSLIHISSPRDRQKSRMPSSA